jgi:hypothetical protein
MHVLRQISTKTTQSTAQTSGAISKLSELASQLRETVRGFRLPTDHSATGILSQAMVAEGLAREQARVDNEAQAFTETVKQRQKAV